MYVRTYSTSAAGANNNNEDAGGGCIIRRGQKKKNGRVCVCTGLCLRRDRARGERVVKRIAIIRRVGTAGGSFFFTKRKVVFCNYGRYFSECGRIFFLQVLDRCTEKWR